MHRVYLGTWPTGLLYLLAPGLLGLGYRYDCWTPNDRIGIANVSR